MSAEFLERQPNNYETRHQQLMDFLKRYGGSTELYGAEFPSFVVPRLVMAFHEMPATQALTIIADNDLLGAEPTSGGPVVAIRRLELGAEGQADPAYEALAQCCLTLPATGAWFWSETLLWQGFDGTWRGRRSMREEISRRSTHTGQFLTTERERQLRAQFAFFCADYETLPINEELAQLIRLLDIVADN